MKTAEQALVESILDGLASEDISVIEKAAHVAEQVDSYREHVAATGPKIEKGIPMTKYDELLRAIAKNVVDRATPAVFDKSAYVKAIERRAAEIRKAGRSDAQAFTDCITGDEVGQTLFAAMKFAKGREVEEGDVDQDDVKPAVKGPANLELERLASAHLKAHPELGRDALGRPKADGGRASAVAYVFGADRDLAARVRAEDLAGIPRTPPGHAMQVAPARAANHGTMVRTA